MPKLDSAGRALMRPSSCCSTRFSSIDSPPPPYCFGHIGHVQPFSAIRVSQTRDSGLTNFSRRPPHTVSSSLPGVRIDGGQFASSQARVSLRNVSRSVTVVTLISRQVAILARLSLRAQPFGRSAWRICYSAADSRKHEETMAGTDAAFDGRTFRNTLSQFCTGVVVATGVLDGQPAGFAAQSFTSLSLDPPLVAVCPGQDQHELAEAAPVRQLLYQRSVCAPESACAISSRSRASSPTSRGSPA